MSSVFAAQQPPAPAFRTGVELVQVSVIAQDNQGNPVTDLRREEFKILHNGVSQEIRLFLAEVEKFNAPAQVTASNKAPNTFTNRIPATAGS
jgi:hypothetical protein